MFVVIGHTLIMVYGIVPKIEEISLDFHVVLAFILGPTCEVCMFYCFNYVIILFDVDKCGVRV